MLKPSPWALAFVVVLSIAPAIAGSKDADAKPAGNTTNGAAQPAAVPATPSASHANVTALLGVLVMKGVLAPSEANAIKDAAPDAEMQLLLNALARKGVVTADDLSAASVAAPSPAPQGVAAALTTPPAP